MFLGKSHCSTTVTSTPDLGKGVAGKQRRFSNNRWVGSTWYEEECSLVINTETKEKKVAEERKEKSEKRRNGPGRERGDRSLHFDKARIKTRRKKSFFRENQKRGRRRSEKEKKGSGGKKGVQTKWKRGANQD